MNLWDTIELLGGGPGSGCNPDVGRCGRPPLQGKLNYQGLRISIENRRGSYRTGRSSVGVKWKTKMKHHYGYLRGVTKDNTHEKRDVYVGPHKSSTVVFIVNQLKKDSKEIDEQKYMIGFRSLSEAKRGFLEHFPDSSRVGKIIPIDIDDFKRKITDSTYEGRLL